MGNAKKLTIQSNAYFWDGEAFNDGIMNPWDALRIIRTHPRAEWVSIHLPDFGFDGKTVRRAEAVRRLDALNTGP